MLVSHASMAGDAGGGVTAGAAPKCKRSPCADIAIEVSSATKAFAGTIALNEVSVAVRSGEAHVFVGENGAGKSTLLGALSGRVQLTSGHVHVHGTRLRTGDPRASRRLGIATVYQELTLVPDMSAVANVFLGQTLSRRCVTRDAAMRRRFGELCQSLEASIQPATMVRDLPLAAQQELEILRGVQSGARILLLDEPTAALAEGERARLWDLVRRLKQDGCTVIFVSHNLDEVLKHSDSVTVLRDGKLVATRRTAGLTERDLVRAMVGKDVEVSTSRSSSPADEVLLEASHVSIRNRLFDVGFTVRRGEVIGLAGLVGSGRTSFLRALAGLEPDSSGELLIEGEAIAWPRSVRKGLDAGLALLTDDRRSALVGGMSVGDNLFLGVLSQYLRGALISDRRKMRDAAEIIQKYRLRGGTTATRVANLSGGNQQKVLLGKWVERRPRVLLVDEPTRGIDVAAKAEILESLDRLAAAGMSVIMASSEHEEVMAMSDRVLVFRGGRIVAELDPRASQLGKQSILEHAFEVGET